MQEFKINNWENFKSKISEIKNNYGQYELKGKTGIHILINKILYRGQNNTDWPLLTTLERKSKKIFSVEKYIEKAYQTKFETNNFTGKNWRIPDFKILMKDINDKTTPFKIHLPLYNYLVYLRHYGFPSPLLDWSECPYIAAFFALSDLASKKNSAVYCYIERTRGVKGNVGGAPQITVMGPHIDTDVRHFSQKASYTISSKFDYNKKKHYFCNHEIILTKKQKNQKQDILIKLDLDSKIKKDALRELNEKGINDFTLFKSEDSLIKSVSMKVFDNI